MTTSGALPPTHPVTPITADVLGRSGLVPPNAVIIWVPIGDSHRHPVPVYRHGTVQIYPHTQVRVRSDQGNPVELGLRLNFYLVQDDRAGVLPISGHDFHFAYAIAQDWARVLRTKEASPADWSTIARWAEAYHRRTPISTSLIHQLLEPRSDTPPDPGTV